MRKRDSSWQKVAPWYNKITEGGGHYYHQHVVVPKSLKLLNLQTGNKLLDLACGNGVLAKSLPKDVDYTGVDLAPALIAEAKRTDKNHRHKYIVSDITKGTFEKNFTHAAIILALQNVQNPLNAIKNASESLVRGGVLVIVLNHPAFRIPRQSSWGIDERTKMQYRRIDRYMTPMNIPINVNPSDKNSEVVISYHYPISYYSSILNDSGFVIEKIEEWTSDKESAGKASRMENRARSEFPLFMAIRAKKVL